MAIIDHQQNVVTFAQQLGPSGLSAGKSGNVSLRVGEQVFITPSGVDYSELQPADIVCLPMNFQGNSAPANGLPPSSEWRFHLDLYRQRTDLSAIVHAHPTYCTALACTGRHIPAFHYMVAIAGGSDIPLAAYALFGSEALSQNIVAVMQDRNACLMETHGMLAAGRDLKSAFHLALEVETLARQYCEALKLGNVNYLDQAQMRDVLEQFKHYGQRN